MKIRGTTVGTPIKPESVLCKPRSLSEAQKEQARENIGALGHEITKPVYVVSNNSDGRDSVILTSKLIADNDDMVVNALNLQGDRDGHIDLDAVVLRGLHEGVEDTDAVNKGQLDSAVEAIHAVLYTEQSLNDEEKAQARKNIGAIADGDYVTELTADFLGVADSEDPSAPGMKRGAYMRYIGCREDGTDNIILIGTESETGDVAISGIAPGIEDTDAVNKKQLDDAMASKADASYFVVVEGGHSANLFDKTAPRESGLLIPNGTTIAQATEHATIAVVPGKTYTFPIQYSWFGNADAYKVNCYDAELNRLTYAYGAVSSGTPNADNTLLTFTVPTDMSAPVAFVKVNVAALASQTALGVHIDKFMFVEGTEYPGEYIPYGEVDGSVSLSPDVKLNVNPSPLYGKTVVFTGDSICAGTSDESGVRGWSQRIGEKHKMNWTNRGINGATITSGVSGSSGCIADTDFGKNPDYIILEGGTNDADLIGSPDNFKPEKFGSYKLGQYNAEFDKTTFCGAVEHLFKRVTTDYAGAKIGFIIAHKMGYATTAAHYDAATSRRRAYFETIIELCKKWGIPYLDLWEGCYLCPMNPAHNTANTNLMYVGDYQHLAKKGYDYITPMIEKWMESL